MKLPAILPGHNDNGTDSPASAAQPAPTPDQVKAILMKISHNNFLQFSFGFDPITSSSYFSQYDLFTIGTGYVDIAAAVNSRFTAVWGSTAVWGITSVRGWTAVWGSRARLGLGSRMGVSGSLGIHSGLGLDGGLGFE